MKRKLMLNLSLMLSLVMGVSFLGGGKGVLAENYESITSPSLESRLLSFIKKDDGNTGYRTTIMLLDKHIKLTEATEILSQLEEDEALFAVFIDSKKGILGKEFFIGGKTHTATCEFDMPFYSDIVDVHLYKQKVNEPAFTIKKENFMGHTKFFMPHDTIFYRPEGDTQIIPYDDDNIPATEPLSSAYLTRLTPNLYSLKVGSFSAGYKDYLEIILPEDKADLLTDEEKIMVSSVYMIFGQREANVADTNRKYFDFYLPDGINEFTLRYHVVNYQGVETKAYNYYVNLNKQ